MAKPTEIKAFSFLESTDPQAVADQLLRAGWTRKRVIFICLAVKLWASAIENAFQAAEESQKDEE